MPAAKEFVPIVPAGFDIAGSYECGSEAESREIVNAAMGRYL